MEVKNFEAEDLDWRDLFEYAMDFLRRLSPGSPWELLEEVAQDTLVSLHVAAKTTRIICPKAWLHTVLRRKFFDQYRRTKTAQMRLSSGDPRSMLGQGGRFPHPEDSAGAASIRRFLDNPNNAFSPRSRAYVEELLDGASRADLARAYGRSGAAVTQAMNRLAIRLAAALRSA